MHPGQRRRQHAGHGAAAVDDDRRAVPAQGPGHNGRRSTVAGLFFHIRNGEDQPVHDANYENQPDHVAVRWSGRFGGLFHRGVLARNARQDPIAN